MVVKGLPEDVLPEAVELVERLIALGQGHLFENWENLTSEQACANKKRLIGQLSKLESSYPGGLEAYIERAKDLLLKSKRGENPFEGYTPSVPECVSFPFSATDESLTQAENDGRECFGKAAFVLVAGGLGERLGFSGIKVALPSEISSGVTYLDLYCRFIGELQGKNHVPLAIMTSDDTHERTVELLESSDFFGLSKTQVHVIKQEKVPSLVDDQAKLALEPEDPFQVLTKPHGHGDVHILLHQTGLAQQWLEAGLEWVVFFQDTNPLSFRTIPASLGVSRQRGFDVCSVAIPRKAKAAAGAIMKLTHVDGDSITINVEYNFVDSLLRATISPDEGDMNGPDGYSPFPGNMNQLIFALEPYVRNLERTGGAVPEFVNPKYKDESRTTFKSPTRLECMMQDYPLTLVGNEDAPKIGVTVFEDSAFEAAHLSQPSLTHRLYAPAKNNLYDAADKASKGIPDASATSSELAIYACNALMLKDLGCHVGDPKAASYGGIHQPEWAHVVFLPRFLPLFSDLKRRFLAPDQVVISSSATLVVDGDVTFVGPVHLDGALCIEASPGSRVTVLSVDVKNEGIDLVPVDPHDTEQLEVFRIRGFKLSLDGGGRTNFMLCHSRTCSKVCVQTFPEPKEYVVEIKHNGIS